MTPGPGFSPSAASDMSGYSPGRSPGGPGMLNSITTEVMKLMQ